MTSTNEYVSLFSIWEKEKSLEDLQPLELNFFTNLEELIQQEKTNITEGKGIELLIIKRLEFMLQSLKDLRQKKILNSVLKNEKIKSALLTNKEKQYYDIISRLHYFNIGDSQLTDFKGNLDNEVSLEDAITKTDLNNEKLISVKTLKNIPKFIDQNKNIYGPFQVDQIIQLPLSMCESILIPNKYVEFISNKHE